MSKLVMGYWDCPYCGSKEIRGDMVNCPSCGRARGEVKFYIKGHTEDKIRDECERGDLEYIGEEQEKFVNRNPDWYCSFCNSLNSDNAQSCGNCGASREDSEANYFEMLKKKEEREAAETAAQPQVRTPEKRSRKPLFIFAAILLAVILVFIWLNGNKTSGDLTVSALRWDRVIHVEEYQNGSDWGLPSGADLVETKEETRLENEVRYREERVQRSRTVVDHYVTKYGTRDLGNGYFEEYSWEEPVYGTETYWETVNVPYTIQVPRLRTKYYFKIWRLNPSLDITAFGQDHKTYWPDVNLPENQREAISDSREEAYYISVTDPKTETTRIYSIAESDWMKINTGDHIYISSKRSGAKPYISDQKGNKIADLELVR